MSDSESFPATCKPKPCFPHLPVFLQERIVNKTDFLTRCSLRETSKKLKYVVDHSCFYFDEVSLFLNENKVTLRVNTDPDITFSVEYQNAPHLNHISTPLGGTIESPDHVKRAVKDVSSLLKSPKCTVGELIIRFDLDYKKNSERSGRSEFLNDWTLFLQTIDVEFRNMILDVQSIEMDLVSEDDLLSVLSLVKPKALEVIVLKEVPNQKFDRLIETDHWKLARFIEVPEITEIRNLAHAESVTLASGNVTLEEFKQLIQILLENPIFFLFEAEVEFNVAEFEVYIQQFQQRIPDTDYDRFLPIPNTNDFMRIVLGSETLQFFILERLSPENLYKDLEEE